MAVFDRTSKEFEDKVLKSDKFVLVDFWAPWCMPCRMMAPVLEELSEDSDLVEKIEICKVDTDNIENQKLSIQYQIQSIPNMKLFHDGEVVMEFIGFRSKGQLKAEILSAIKG